MLVFSYVDQPGMVGSPERTRQLCGRVLPIHLERAGWRVEALIDYAVCRMTRSCRTIATLFGQISRDETIPPADGEADMLRNIALSLFISIAIYPIVFLGTYGLFALGAVATDLEMPSDIMPLVYGLVFAVLTVALIDFLGVASVVMALIACANLIEYAQLVIPDRSASVVDFVASIAGIVIAALLVWAARTLVQRLSPEEPVN